MTAETSGRPDHPAVPNRLRRQWARYALIAIMAWGGLWAVVRAGSESEVAGWWALAAGAVLAYVLTTAYRHLQDNRRAGEGVILGRFGAGTTVTLARGLLIGLLAGFLALPKPASWLAWLPALIYFLVDVGDFFDGYLARRAGMQTLLGERLDIEFDALGLLVAAGVAITWGHIGGWFLLVGGSRYLYLGALKWRQRRGHPLQSLPPSSLRRPLAGLMMVFVAILLWPVFTPSVVTAAAVTIGLPFLAGFTRDGLVAGGWMLASNPGYVRLHQRVKDFMAGPAPIILRGLVAIAWIATARLSEPEMVAWRWIGGLMAILVLLGIAGRVVALALALLTALLLSLDGISLPGVIVLMGSLSLAVTGSGPLSVWRVEERLVDLRIGNSREKG